jgi:hypothetical protein
MSGSADSGSANIFQAEMMDLMEALEYVQAYIDDLLVITRGTLEDHLVKLDEVLKRLLKLGLKVNSTKSFFCTRKIEYFCYREFNRFWDHIFGRFTHNPPC